jgi:hypothetical protein
MANQMCGRRAPEGNAPPTIEQLAGRLNQANSPTQSLTQQIDAAVREGAVRALRRRSARQASLAAAGRFSPEHFPSVNIATGESTIAHRLATVLSAIADELEAEGNT